MLPTPTHQSRRQPTGRQPDVPSSSGSSRAPIVVPTAAVYRGLPVTVFGVPGETLLEVAALGTPQETALAALRVRRHDGRDVYGIAGTSHWTSDVTKAAAAAAALREI